MQIGFRRSRRCRHLLQVSQSESEGTSFGSRNTEIAAGLHFPKSQSYCIDFYPLVFRRRKMELFGKSETALSPIWSFVMLHVLVRMQRIESALTKKRTITELTKNLKECIYIEKIYWPPNNFPLRLISQSSPQILYDRANRRDGYYGVSLPPFGIRGITYPIFVAGFVVKIFIPRAMSQAKENRIVAAFRIGRIAGAFNSRDTRGRIGGDGRRGQGERALHRREKGPKVIWRRMSAWGDIQSFGGKSFQDGGFGPIASNRGGAWKRWRRTGCFARFMDSLGRSPAKLSCLSGSGLRVPGGPCQESIFRRISALFPGKFRMRLRFWK